MATATWREVVARGSPSAVIGLSNATSTLCSFASCSTPVVDDARPLRPGRAAATPGPRGPPSVRAGLGEHHLVATPTQPERGLQTRRAGADHQDLARRSPSGGCVRVPAAPPLLAHRRVLGAADRHGHPVARRRRCCSRCTRGCRPAGPPRSSPAGTDRRWSGAPTPMKSVMPAAHQAHHRVGRRVAADDHDRLRGQLPSSPRANGSR